MNDNLTPQELKRVNNALDALRRTNQTPSRNGWETIMEESNKRKRQISNRRQWISIAAAIALVVGIGSTALALTNSNENGAIKTVDKRPNSTLATTTSPRTPKEVLLNGSLMLKLAPGANPADGNFEPKIYTSDGKLLKDFSTNNVWASPYVSGSHLVVRTTSGNSECEDMDQGLKFVDINLQTFKATDLKDNYRVYSPSGTQYAEYKQTCSVMASELKIVNIKNKTTKIIKTAERQFGTNTSGFDYGYNGKALAGTGGKLFWINEAEVFVDVIDNIYNFDDQESSSGGNNIATEPGPLGGWHTLNIKTANNFSDVKEVSETFAGSWDDGISVRDVKSVLGTTTVLALDPNGEAGSYKTINAYDLSSGKIIWTEKIDAEKFEQFVDVFFGESTNTIYGAYGEQRADDTGYYYTVSKAFGIDRENSYQVTPDGAILIPNR